MHSSAEFRVPGEVAATKLEGLGKRQQNKPFYMAIMQEQAWPMMPDPRIPGPFRTRPISGSQFKDEGRESCRSNMCARAAAHWKFNFQ